MVKLVFCLHRRSDVGEAEFHRYWREVHGPLAASFAPVLGFTRYVQVHTTSVPLSDAIASDRGAPEHFDGVAELWYDSVDNLLAAALTPEGAAAAYLEAARRRAAAGDAEAAYDDRLRAFEVAPHDPGAAEAVAETLRADEARFIDHSRSPIFLAEEHRVL